MTAVVTSEMITEARRRRVAAGLPAVPSPVDRAPKPLVLVNCSAAKRDQRARAVDLYDRSVFFRAAKAAALRLNPAGWWIISAEHGLVHPDSWLHPYDRRLGQPGAITPDEFRETVPDRLLDQPNGVVCLTTSSYTAMARTVWPDADAPLERSAPPGKRNGIGWMRSHLQSIAKTGDLGRDPGPLPVCPSCSVGVAPSGGLCAACIASGSVARVLPW